MRIGRACQRKILAGRTCGLAIFVAGLISWPYAGVSAEKTYQPDPANCAGFTAKDAAAILGVPAEKITSKIDKVHTTLWTCTFSGGQPGKSIAFSIEVAKSAKAAAADMEQYRSHLETAAETAPFKNKLPKGAYSEIGGSDNLGDENVWTDVNGSFTARKGNITIQVITAGDKIEKIKIGQAVLSKF